MVKILSKKNNKIKKQNSGFAMLFAVLLASFLVTLGVSIFSISLKEIQITTSIRDSQIAYYAADSARECALYWDAKEGAFPVVGINADKDTEVVPITCNGTSVQLSFTKIDGTDYTMLIPKYPFFQASSTSSSTPVASIKITKESLENSIRTTIESYGYNTSILGRRVERGIKTVNNNN